MRWKVLESSIVYRAGVFDIRRDRSRADRTGREHDFHVVEARDWVTVVPITADDEVVLVRQFRHGIGGLTLEVPAGVIDPEDPNPERAAARELREETGYEAPRLVSLGSVHPNPALFNNRCHLFLAEAAQRVGPPQWDGTEELEIETVPVAEIGSLVRRGEILNAMTLVAFQLWALHRPNVGFAAVGVPGSHPVHESALGRSRG